MKGYMGRSKDAAPPINYDQYLRVPQLIDLQHCRSSPPHHDEMLFIITHQAYELWFRLILHECDSAMAAMGRDDTITAERQLGRVVEIQRLLVPQIHILETMWPSDFLAFRENLKPSSGFQSAQFREIEIVSGLKDVNILNAFRDEPEVQARIKARLASPTLSDAFYELLRRKGFPIHQQPARIDTEAWESWRDEAVEHLLKVYMFPAQYNDIYRLTERLIEFDEYISLWRFHHVRMVERMIGMKIGTGGSDGVTYLTQTLSVKSFPELWQLRTFLEQPKAQLNKQNQE
jgi:tryptophan 2,3-dioxygenase